MNTYNMWLVGGGVEAVVGVCVGGVGFGGVKCNSYAKALCTLPTMIQLHTTGLDKSR